jgi:hypothetical protein
MSAFREAQADESVMISFGPYSPGYVEEVFSEVQLPLYVLGSSPRIMLWKAQNSSGDSSPLVRLVASADLRRGPLKAVA